MVPPLFPQPYKKGATRNFKYGKRQMGAFRLVRADDLLNTSKPPEFNVFEHPNIIWGRQGRHKSGLSKLNSDKHERYVAISHVWDHADEVNKELKINMPPSDKFYVDIDPDPSGISKKPLSWPGLQQVAYAVKRLNADYFWLDFLCLDQIEKKNLPNDQQDMEKKLQICMMSDIYKYAWNVVVMIHGIGLVWDLSASSAWMDRAWTLQETVVNWKHTWVYVRCPDTQQKTVTDPLDKKRKYVFMNVPKADARKSKTSLYLVKILDLIDMADTKQTSAIPKVEVLNGATKMSGASPRRALRASFMDTNKPIQYTGVWRSMFMRTSTHPVDVVYSIMGIFGLQIDPYRKNRPSEYLFNDLARKTAAFLNIGPAWLTIGGVAGSDIPRSPASRIVFRFPHTEAAGKDGNDKPPKMTFTNNVKEWVGYHVDDSPFFVKKFDIRFLTQSHPHIINAIMLPVTYIKTMPDKTLPRPGSVKGSIKRYSARCGIGTMKGNLVYNGRLKNPKKRGIMAVLVGDVGDMRHHHLKMKAPKYDFTDQKFLLFFQYANKTWKVIADGVYKPDGWHWRGSNRFIFTVGDGAQRQLDKWPTQSKNWVDRRSSIMQLNYGIDPIEDWRVTNKAKKIITWFGLTGHRRPSEGWTNYPLRLRISDMLGDKNEKKLARALKTPRTMVAVSVLEPVGQPLPRTSRTYTKYGIIEECDINVALSYSGWTKSQCADLANAGVDGLLIPKTKSSSVTVFYQVKIEFGEQVMYVQVRPRTTKIARRPVRQEYWQMYVVPYSIGPGVNRKFENAVFIANPSTFNAPLGLDVLPGQPLPYGTGMNPIAPGEDAEGALRRWRTRDAWVDRSNELRAMGLPVTGRGVYWLTKQRIANGLSGW